MIKARRAFSRSLSIARRRRRAFFFSPLLFTHLHLHSPKTTQNKKPQAAINLKPPVTLTVANRTFPSTSLWPSLRPWSNPNKNTTLSSLSRAAGQVANSSNPLNATKAVAQGLALHSSETKALISGQSDLVTFVGSISASSSSSPPGDLRCFVDPSTGQLVGLEQGGAAACSTSGDVVVVPTSSGYISQIQLAYTYDGKYVARLIFDLKANATAEPVSYSCGSAGGQSRGLAPER